MPMLQAAGAVRRGGKARAARDGGGGGGSRMNPLHEGEGGKEGGGELHTAMWQWKSIGNDELRRRVCKRGAMAARLS